MNYIKNCPSCNSPDFKIIGPKGKKIIDRLGEIEVTQEEYYIYKCSNCGLYFRSPILDDGDLNLHYSNYDYKVLHNSELFPTEQTIYKFLKGQQNRRLKKNILDYGCNEGVFLSLFVNDFNCYGYEIDDRVKKLAEQKGITILDDDKMKKNNLKFDYILLIDVFEHLKKPTETILYLLNFLNINGKLIISTGYADSDCCKNDLANYWYFSECMQHVCMIGDDYINYLQKEFKLKLSLKKSLSHYNFKINFRESAFYYIRYKIYLGYRFLSNIRGFKSIVRYIPVVNKAETWKEPPYYPPIHNRSVQKDHVVLVFNN